MHVGDYCMFGHMKKIVRASAKVCDVLLSSRSMIAIIIGFATMMWVESVWTAPCRAFNQY